MRSRFMTLAAALLVLALTGQFSRGTPGDAGDYASTKALEGADVVNKAGEKIGELQGFVMNPQTGKLDFAVIESGGVLGMGEKSILVPWQACQVDRGGDEPRVTLDATADKLQGGFEYKEEELGQIPIDEIFGYWGVDRAAMKNEGSAPAAGSSAPAPNPETPPQGNPSAQNPGTPSPGNPAGQHPGSPPGGS